MKLSIGRYSLRITPEDRSYPSEDARDTAFIEEVLGLKKDGDSVRLVRRNASGLSCIAYLETKDKLSNIADDSFCSRCYHSPCLCKEPFMKAKEEKGCICPNGSLCEFFKKETETCLYGDI